MYTSSTKLSDTAPHRSQSQFSVSYWAPFPTLFTVNGLSVALLMRSLVLCNQVLSELRRVHFTGSQGTRSNQNAVFFPVCSNTTITFHHCCAVTHSWRKAGTREQTNKHTDREWIQRRVTEPEAESFLPFLSIYFCQLHWNGCNFAVLFSKKSAVFEHVPFLCSKNHHIKTKSHTKLLIYIKKASICILNPT